MELDLLKLLSLKDNYNKYNTYIKSDRLSIDIRNLYSELRGYYTETGEDTIVWSDLYTWYTTLKHPNIDNDKAEVLQTICTKLDSMTTPSNIVLSTFITRSFAAQIADTAGDIMDGDTKLTMEDVDELIQQYKREVKTTKTVESDTNISSNDLESRLEDLKVDNKYDWRLNELQISLGPIKQGDFIIVGARPDGGKTTFLASEATNFAQQLKDDECILWFNNEERLEVVNMRQTQAALGWTQVEVQKDIKKSAELYYKTIGGDKRIITYDDSNISIDDIDRMLEQYNCKIIIIDQLWKVRGFEKEAGNDIVRYSKIAAHLRNIAKAHGPVIGTSQLDNQAENVWYPDMGMLYNSKTAVQGEADAIIMIGRDKNVHPNARYISAPKNKLPWGQSTYRNAGWAVTIDPDHARFISKVARPV